MNAASWAAVRRVVGDAVEVCRRARDRARRGRDGCSRSGLRRRCRVGRAAAPRRGRSGQACSRAAGPASPPSAARRSAASRRIRESAAAGGAASREGVVPVGRLPVTARATGRGRPGPRAGRRRPAACRRRRAPARTRRAPPTATATARTTSTAGPAPGREATDHRRAVRSRGPARPDWAAAQVGLHLDGAPRGPCARCSSPIGWLENRASR